MFEKLKTKEDLNQIALANLIHCNGGWGWFESLCDVLQENNYEDSIDELIAEAERAYENWLEFLESGL